MHPVISIDELCINLLQDRLQVYLFSGGDIDPIAARHPLFDLRQFRPEFQLS